MLTLNLHGRLLDASNTSLYFRIVILIKEALTCKDYDLTKTTCTILFNGK